MEIQRGQGFLLTRNSVDIRSGTEIQYWVSTDNGPALLTVRGESPVFFIEEKNRTELESDINLSQWNCSLKSLDLTTFQGESVCGIYASTQNGFYRAVEACKRHGISTYEADFRLSDRYLMERFIHGGLEFAGQPVQREGYLEYQDCRLKTSRYQPKLKSLSIDIECDLDGELFSIALIGCGTEEVLMIGSEEPVNELKLLWCEDEKALINAFLIRINELDPDLIIGWNVINFDLRLLLQRARRYQIRFSIGRGRAEASWRDQKGEMDKGFIFIPGRVAIDGIDALKTATYSFSRFSLENVSRELLGKGKLVENDVDDRIAEIKHNFLHNKSQLAAYNLEDARLVVEIFTHTQILDFLRLRSELTGLEIDRIGGSVAAFTNLYCPKLHRAGYIAPNLPGEGGLASPGGYVMDSKPGLYKNVLVLDYKSLYPSIIRTFKIDPMGLIEGLKDPNSSIPGYRGGVFHRTQHFLPDIIESLWKQRDVAKKDNDAAGSQAIKILMNSFYGVLGSGGCRFYDPRLASSITLRGHDIMQTTARWIQAKGYEVIYGDTDSVFVLLGDGPTAKQCDKTGQQLVQDINEKWKRTLREELDLDCFLEMEYETHFSRFLMPTVRGSDAGSKKRYAGLISAIGKENDDDHPIDRIIYKGLENVRTDWTVLAREFQAELYELIFHDQSPVELIKRTVEETLAGERDNQLVYRKQLRRKLDLYVKNVPPHVRAARLADEENKRLGKRLRYQNKGWISYVMTMEGPEPVEYQRSPFDYQLYIDRQLKPVAEAILPFIELEFESIISPQQVLF